MDIKHWKQPSNVNKSIFMISNENDTICCILSNSTGGGGGGTLHKFGQGCSFKDIFCLPPKITDFRFQPPKHDSIFVPKTNVILVLQLSRGYTCNFFLAMSMQFQEIIALPSRGKNCMCSMSCTGNATSSEKLPKYCKLLIFWQFCCQQILPSHRVAGSQFFRAMATQ